MPSLERNRLSRHSEELFIEKYKLGVPPQAEQRIKKWKEILKEEFTLQDATMG
eukprot:m.118754 g.118754  ORF g.118754 m.118754 type:complete len:53 (+) comp14290_c0_seq3:703-861(+)